MILREHSSRIRDNKRILYIYIYVEYADKMRAHKRRRARCILFFRERKVSFISAHASEQVSISGITPRVFPRNFFRRRNPPNLSRGRKKRNRYHGNLPVSFPPVSLLSFLSSNHLVSHRSPTVPIRKVDVPMLDESSACKQLHNDFGRGA